MRAFRFFLVFRLSLTRTRACWWELLLSQWPCMSSVAEVTEKGQGRGRAGEESTHTPLPLRFEPRQKIYNIHAITAFLDRLLHPRASPPRLLHRSVSRARLHPPRLGALGVRLVCLSVCVSSAAAHRLSSPCCRLHASSTPQGYPAKVRKTTLALGWRGRGSCLHAGLLKRGFHLCPRLTCI